MNFDRVRNIVQMKDQRDFGDSLLFHIDAEMKIHSNCQDFVQFFTDNPRNMSFASSRLGLCLG